MSDIEGLETVLFTAMSVALESLEQIFRDVPPTSNHSVEISYALSAMGDMRKELDSYLEDRDISHIFKVKGMVDEINQRMAGWS